MISASTVLQTKYGPFKVNYHEFDESACVSFSYGDITKNNPIARFHSACLFGESFLSLDCDCNYQVAQTMEAIVKSGAGIIIYSYQEGRGIGLKNKIKAMEIERVENCDTVEAFKKLGFDKPDYRTYEAEVGALKELSVSKSIISFSGNPAKRKAIESAGFNIIEELEIKDDGLSEVAIKEKKVKQEKMGYTYKNKSNQE